MAAQPSPHSQHQLISPFHSNEGELPALSEVLRKIARNAVELLELTDCAIALMDESATGLVLLATSEDDLSSDQVERSVFPLSVDPLAEVVNRHEALVLYDARFDACMRTLAGGATRSLACLPLLDQDRLLGVLIASAALPTAFVPEKLRLLTLLAEQTVLAIANAHQAELMRDARLVKANFLSLVTHELRSPLNAINGYLDLTLEGIAGELNEQQREFLQRARAGSEHLYALLEDLLLASRADAGQLRLQRTALSLEDLTIGAMEELELTAQDAGVLLETVLPPDLPVLFGDAVRLQQVLRNLLSNALRFTPVGGRVTISASLLSEREDGWHSMLEVRVQDTGCGIAPEYHQRIFERFFQVPQPGGGRMSGQGLGLAIVKMLVELHGGSVRVESVPGEGSAFILLLDLLH